MLCAVDVEREPHCDFSYLVYGIYTLYYFTCGASRQRGKPSAERQSSDLGALSLRAVRAAKGESRQRQSRPLTWDWELCAFRSRLEAVSYGIQ